MINASKTGYSDKWATPSEILDPLRKRFQFNYDPCPIDWKEGDADGLKTEWGSSTFCNPPYSRVGEFVKKASEEAAKGKKVVLLINVATDTKWFHEYIYNKPGVSIEFIKGRVKFINPKEPEKRVPSPRPSMLVIWGHPQYPSEITR